jgi:hypothetical protein
MTLNRENQNSGYENAASFGAPSLKLKTQERKDVCKG